MGMAWIGQNSCNSKVLEQYIGRVALASVCDTIRQLRSGSVQSAWGCAGTPVQNSMEELFGIMNVLDADKYSDEADFLARFGKGMPTPQQVQDLQVTPRTALSACQNN